ncbi:MAG: nuclear transport factor 2 family protein [Bacteroidota bacterium]
MITTEIAKLFALEWIKSWNSHNINSIIELYTNDINFYSPFIQLLKFNDTGIITNKEQLKEYFNIGLKSYPDLNFKLHNVFVGINTVVIYYTSVNGHMASEVFELNENAKAVKVFCNYTSEQSVY